MNDEIDGSLVLLGDENSGRDEMNLAGNPFALLHSGARAGQSIIKNEWERRLPSGKIVTATWEVDGHTELGLPGPNEEMLFLVLLKITREASERNGAWSRLNHFSRYDVMQRMGWDNTKRHYNELADCFVRLKSVSINTKYSFWDARLKTPYPAIGFGIIDDYGLADEPKGRKAKGVAPVSSWFTWNETLYGSFLAGNVRSLALDFIFSLEFPTTRRLFRFLDMMRGASTPPRREFSIGLFKLQARLGMKNYRYTSQIKQVLQPAIEELKARNYLNEVRFEKAKDGSELAHFAFASVQALPVQKPKEPGRVGQVGVGQGIPKAQPVPMQLTLSNAGTNDAPPTPAAVPTPDIRLDALRCHAVFKALPESEQNELMDFAKKEVSPIWHDRVGQPESPMSLGLWQLVAARYPERCK